MKIETTCDILLGQVLSTVLGSKTFYKVQGMLEQYKDTWSNSNEDVLPNQLNIIALGLTIALLVKDVTEVVRIQEQLNVQGIKKPKSFDYLSFTHELLAWKGTEGIETVETLDDLI